ncbi:MAG: regulatory signaling modulator protein AmpE [Gammaproteobacteria bacterium]|nr:regulatory signaling modulator protein AmpE [Gammaproteobacteria bacterium]
MNLIVILLALFIERFAPSIDEVREYRWLQRLIDFSLKHSKIFTIGGGVIGLLLILLLPVLIVGLLQARLAEWNSLIYVIFSVIILVYSFGPMNLQRQLKKYIAACDTDNEKAAYEHIDTVVARSKIRDDDEHGLHRAVIEGILVENNERLLGVIFWFVVLGPIGAVLFRLSSVLRDDLFKEGEALQAVAESARILHGLLAWIPARLTAITYALAGSFIDVLECWRQNTSRWTHDWITGNRRLLIETGISALQFRTCRDGVEVDDPADWHSHIDSTYRLGFRTTVIWLIIIALLTMWGWS